MPGTVSEPPTRSVLVVDDHRTVADLLRLALDTAPGLTCVGVAYRADQALRLCRAVSPTLVVCDVNLAPGGMTGLELTRALTEADPAVTVLLLTGDASALTMEDVSSSGASALLAKDGDLASLISALHRAERDRLEIDPRLLRGLTRTAGPAVLALSPREQEVLEQLARGRDVGAISRALGIRPSTCRGYVKALLYKLDAHSQLEAVARARRLGVLGSDA